MIHTWSQSLCEALYASSYDPVVGRTPNRVDGLIFPPDLKRSSWSMCARGPTCCAFDIRPADPFCVLATNCVPFALPCFRLFAHLSSSCVSFLAVPEPDGVSWYPIVFFLCSFGTCCILGTCAPVLDYCACCSFSALPLPSRPCMPCHFELFLNILFFASVCAAVHSRVRLTCASRACLEFVLLFPDSVLLPYQTSHSLSKVEILITPFVPVYSCWLLHTGILSRPCLP